MTGEVEWTVLGLRRLQNVLEGEEAAIVQEVAEAFAEFAKDPENAPGRFRLRGATAARYPHAQAIRLPHNFIVTYEAHEHGMMPLAGPVVMVRAAVRLWSYEPENGEPEGE